MAHVKLTETDCWCGLPFAMPTRLYEQCRKEGETFYCPLGHSVAFKEPEADQLRRERDRLKQRLAQQEDTIKSWAEEAERHKKAATAAKGQVTKLRKRAKHGVCPCCSRTFQNLAAHMKTKHPKFEPEEPLTVIEGGKAA